MASRPNTARLAARRDSYPIASYATRGRAPKTRTQSSMRRPRLPDSSPLTSAIFRPWPAFTRAPTLSATCFSASSQAMGLPAESAPR